MARSPFAPLTPEMLADDRARRAIGEAEIARREAALAEALARLDTAEAQVTALEAELDDAKRCSDEL